MSVEAQSLPPVPQTPRRHVVVKVVSLVSAAHFFSHFYLFLLPPLFPVLTGVYGVGFVELGFALTLFNVTSAIVQAPMGFLVDRFGARRLLITGLTLHALSILLIGVFASYPALLVLMVVSGVANSVYHPADYAILNASIDKRYMGRAFSLHTFSGYTGQAIGPITVISLIVFLPWQHALMALGALGLVVAAIIAGNSTVLNDATGLNRGARGRASIGDGVRLLFGLPVIMGVLFFAGISMSGQGITTFGFSALAQIYDAPLRDITLIVSAYLFAGPLGVLCGGWIADKTVNHDRNVAFFFLISAVCICLVAATSLSIALVAMLLAIAGLFSGMVAPSRDMLIRSVTPPEHIGKVFGFVSVGFNLGGIVAPVAFGYLLDHGEPRLVFWAAGLIFGLTIATVLTTGRVGRASEARKNT